MAARAALAAGLLAMASSLVVAARPTTPTVERQEAAQRGADLAATVRTPTTGAGTPSTAAFDPNHVGVYFAKVARGLSQPLFVTTSGKGSWLYVVEKVGRIKIVSKGVTFSPGFLDISGKVSRGDEQGLLGLAFHPGYESNGKFYVDYTDRNGDTVISEFRRSSTNMRRASTTERVLMRIDQPYANHNGGMLAFGPDGYLYIGMGDGGSSGDPQNRAQNINSLFGKILRININAHARTLPYAIPPTNPFVGKAGDPRIWSLGLCNPWRFSFDRANGALWIGDVGQDRFEEVDRSPAATGAGKGANYGWPVLEGNACYRPSSGCSTSGKTGTLAVYDHGAGCSVTGGYAYRGTAFPALTGAYLFGDFCSGRIWAVDADGAATQTPTQVYDTTTLLSSFGQDAFGTLYITDLGAGDVWQMRAVAR